MIDRLAKRKYILIGLVILLFALWNPVTREILLWLLPLGSGVDDLVFLLIAAISGAYGLAYWSARRRAKENEEADE